MSKFVSSAPVPVPTSINYLAGEATPTLSEQIGALVTRWLAPESVIGLISPRATPEWFHDIRAEHDRIVGILRDGHKSFTGREVAFLRVIDQGLRTCNH
jgi:hypothetical protein